MIRQERGAIALITTVLIGILLTIITTGLASLMISELRQSNDAEQSVRAYYAAQSGVEEALEKVIAGLGTKGVNQDCGAPGSQDLSLGGPSGVIGWTCQRIRYTNEETTGSLSEPDKDAKQINLGDAKFGSMIIEWDTTAEPPGGFPAGYFDAPASFTEATNWNYAPLLEVGIITYPDTAFEAETPGAITLVNALIAPQTAGAGLYSINAVKGGNPLRAVCDEDRKPYHCRLVIDNMNPGGRNTILRLRARYAATDYRLTFTTGNAGSGAVVPVADGSALIDVTAKAGDVYRRVVYRVPIENGAAAGLDYVIYSETDVCKNFSTFGGSVSEVGCPYP